jgi:hypothetical protein
MRIRQAMLVLATAILVVAVGETIARAGTTWRVIARGSSPLTGFATLEKNVRSPHGLAIRVAATPTRGMRADWSLMCSQTPYRPPYAQRKGTARWRSTTEPMFRVLRLPSYRGLCSVFVTATQDDLNPMGPVRLQLLKR